MIRLTLALVLAAPTAGCVTFRGPEALQREVATRCNRELVPRAAMSLDTIALLLSPLPPELAEAAWHVRWFRAGVYSVGPTVEPAPPLELRRIVGDEWHHLMYAREEFGEVQAVVRSRKDRLTDLAILIYDGDELTIVRLDGRIDRFLEDPDTTAGLMDRIDALRTFFEHLDLAQRLFRSTGAVHREHHHHLRDVLDESGWGRQPTDEPDNTFDSTGSPP